MDEQHLRRDRTFVRLTLGAVIVTFLMITIGAITRVTESGLGCGPHWPLCNGRLIPEFATIEEVIEKGHRLFALLVGAFGGLVVWRAYRDYRGDPRLYTPAVWGFVLFFVQSGLGAITVWAYALWPNAQWVTVIIHLSNAMFMLAAYVILWGNARRLLLRPVTVSIPVRRVLPVSAVLMAAGMTFLVAVAGAAVAGTNATKACVGWPLCSGELWPAEQGPLQMLNMLHRLAAGGLGLLLLLLTLMSFSNGVQREVRAALTAANALYLAQAGLGALVVLIDQREVLTISRSLHVTFAAATWSALFYASAAAWLQLSSNVAVRRTPPQAGVAPSATTFS